MVSPVQQIKERIAIEDVVSSYIKLERAGANFKAKCPFHNEKTASFFVSPDRGSYYCFGCGAKGDIFTFIEEFEGLDFKGALKILADRAGVILEEFNSEKEGEKERLYKAMEEAAKFFEKNLATESAVLRYLKGRGLNEKTINDFRIGYIKQDWRELYNHLKNKNFTDEEAEKAGLAKKTEKGYYDRFRGRIMFPISDTSGRVIAFSGRIFIDDGKSAKYLNSPETPIFSKSAVLYGLDKAKDSIRKNNFSILVEGQMDLTLSHQAGFRNTVATSGTALSDSTMSKENVVSNLGLLRRLSSNIVLAFDADKAGFNASIRAAKIALSFGMDVKVVAMPEGVDPADIVSKEGPDAWRRAIRNSKHIIEFLLEKITNENKGNIRKIDKEIREKVLQYVDVIDSAIEKARFIKKISEITNNSEDAVRADLLKVGKDQEKEKEEIEKAKKEEEKLYRKDYIERRLMGLVLWQQDKENKLFDVDGTIKEIADILGININDVKNKFEKTKEDLIYEAEVFYSGDVDIKDDIKELLANFKEEQVNEKLFEAMQDLKKYEQEKNIGKINNTLKIITDLNNKKQEIKNNRL